MYMDHDWTPITGPDLAGLLEPINPIGGKHWVKPETTMAETRQLPFYDWVELIRVKDPAWEPKNLFIYYLRDKGKLFALNGTSPPIHELNKVAPIGLTEDNCIDYLEFFCFFVRGEDGPFIIAQSTSDTYVPKEIDEKTRLVLENTIRPVAYNGTDDAGNFLCDATIFYSNAIFVANFRIEPGGMIHMTDDEPVAADLPVKVDAPIA